jgi:hypothetical protein
MIYLFIKYVLFLFSSFSSLLYRLCKPIIFYKNPVDRSPENSFTSTLRPEKKIKSCMNDYFTSVKMRTFLIKVKNNCILLYMIFFLYNGWIRCSNTKTMNVCCFYLKKYIADNTIIFDSFGGHFIKANFPTNSFCRSPENSFSSTPRSYEKMYINSFNGNCADAKNKKYEILKLSLMLPSNMVRFIKNIYIYNAIFNYFYLNNLKTDFITIKNDIEICYNNFMSPLFWAFLALFLRL